MRPADRLVDYLREHGPATVTDIASALDYGMDATLGAITAARRQGVNITAQHIHAEPTIFILDTEEGIE